MQHIYLLTPRFLQRRAALPIIETQKSPWNVSDRFVSRKNNEVTVWIMNFFSLFTFKKCVPELQEARQVRERAPQR